MFKNDIILQSIGIIHSPYKTSKDMPIQGTFENSVEAHVEINKELENGLKDLNGFSHIILIYYFHQSKRTELIAKPFLENEEHGIFAIRSPYRPNHIGFTTVEISKIDKNIIYFKGVDMLDGTPLLDIKPYVKEFDFRENTRSGWIAKHFEKNTLPEDVFISEKNTRDL